MVVAVVVLVAQVVVLVDHYYLLFLVVVCLTLYSLLFSASILLYSLSPNFALSLAPCLLFPYVGV